MTDITETLAPKSEQLDAIDLMGKPPRIFTVTKVDVKNGAEQPVSVHLAEFPRVWRPGVSMRRVLAYCWGPKSVEWVGRQVELFCDETVKFGNETPGGTRISRLSHIEGPKSVPLLLSKGKSGTYKVDPLPVTAPTVAAPTDRRDALKAEWHTATAERRTEIEAEAAALDTADPPNPETPDPSTDPHPAEVAS